ncbi:MAG: hypothetical protein HOP29_13750 [Phycisphaerales bacterium]|nr:hypothetical protein [Phycisphaerales bacterium]
MTPGILEASQFPFQVDLFSVRAATFNISNPAVRIYGGFNGGETARLTCSGSGSCTAQEPGDDCVGGTGTCVENRPFASPAILSGDIDNDNTLDTDNAYHVVTYDTYDASNHPVLDGFTVEYGYANGSNPDNQGAAVQIRDNSRCIPGGPILRNCIFEDNYSSGHAAVNDHAVTTEIHDCTFRYNLAGTAASTESRGAGLLVEVGNTKVTNCMFDSNTVVALENDDHFGEGGGVWVGLNRDCTVAGGSYDCQQGFDEDCDGVGEAIGVVEIKNSEFCNNEAERGGGIYIDAEENNDHEPEYRPGPKVRVIDCSFYNNVTYGRYLPPGLPYVRGGAGIWNESGQAFNVSNSSFVGNEAYGVDGHDECEQNEEPKRSNEIQYGGAIYNIVPSGMSGTTVDIDNCLFRENKAAAGGAIYNLGPLVACITNCDFESNVAKHWHEGCVGNLSAGGASFDAEDTVMSYVNCRFLDNSADRGGAIWQISVTHLENGLLVGNLATTGNGGAVLFESNKSCPPPMTPCPSTVTNCTIVGNDADDKGGGIARLGTQSLNVFNTILWGNTAAGSVVDDQLHITSSNGVSLTYSAIEDYWSECEFWGWGCALWFICTVPCDEHNLEDDPGFVSAAGGDFHLGSTSPCIDVGSNADAPLDTCDVNGDENTSESTPDLDLAARIVDGPDPGSTPTVDMGCYEYQP